METEAWQGEGRRTALPGPMSWDQSWNQDLVSSLLAHCSFPWCSLAALLNSCWTTLGGPFNRWINQGRDDSTKIQGEPPECLSFVLHQRWSLFPCSTRLKASLRLTTVSWHRRMVLGRGWEAAWVPHHILEGLGVMRWGPILPSLLSALWPWDTNRPRPHL